MYIESLDLKNFRNYEELHLTFDRGINVFFGDNAQGKTNILEALYVCATSRSHRGSKDREMIRFGQEEAHLRMEIRKQDIPGRIDMHFHPGKSRGIAIGGIPIRKASELFGVIHVVCFSPEDLGIVKNGPAERRQFLNMELCQLDRGYVSDLLTYNKVLQQRNQLLKDLYFRPDLEDTLDVWDEQLIKSGREIIKKRRKFVKELNTIIRDIHLGLSGGREELFLTYEPDIEEED
ncbi:MAG TPA: DNA replication and repair protein RecF, partial [Lachnospiraceae bacterium]|nr:DNA replication and repair protein RecF [Lachnospiraceae bacterium]